MELTNSNLKNEEDLTQPHLKDTFDYNGTSTIEIGRSRQWRPGNKQRDKKEPSSKWRHSKQPTSSSDNNIANIISQVRSFSFILCK